MAETSAVSRSVTPLGRLRAATVSEKPWGREFVYPGDVRASTRILEIKEGHALSLANHGGAAASLCVLVGHAWFHLNGFDFEVLPGAYLTLLPDDLYGLEASTQTLILISNAAPPLT